SPHGLYPSRRQLQHFSEGKSNPGSTGGRGRSADAARIEHGISKSRAAGSMACYLRVISRVQASGNSHFQSQATRRRALPGDLSGSPLEQKGRPGSRDAPPSQAATPADTAFNPSSPPFARSPKYRASAAGDGVIPGPAGGYDTKRLS